MKSIAVALAIGVVSGTLPPLTWAAQATANPACAPRGPLPGALLTCRNWVTFVPPFPFNPNTRTFPTDADLRKALTRLYAEGWRGIVTYSLDGSLQDVPRLAKEVGFTSVIAGLYWFDDAQLARERTAALAQVGYIDAFVLGNEGLQDGHYTLPRLVAEIQRLKTDTSRPVTTSEALVQYQSMPRLATLGDWLFPNLQFWFDPAIRTPALAVGSVQAQLQILLNLAPGRPVVVKEAWWPTSGDVAATSENQAEFYRQLAATKIKFIWGEAYDQSYKIDQFGQIRQGPAWGLHSSTGNPKRIIPVLQSIYTGAY